MIINFARTVYQSKIGCGIVALKRCIFTFVFLTYLIKLQGASFNLALQLKQNDYLDFKGLSSEHIWILQIEKKLNPLKVHRFHTHTEIWT